MGANTAASNGPRVGKYRTPMGAAGPTFTKRAGNTCGRSTQRGGGERHTFTLTGTQSRSFFNHIRQ